MTMNQPTHIPAVVLADDHPVVRLGIRIALESQKVARVVAEAGGPAELFQVLSGTPCDVIVTDFSMPDDQGKDGLSLIERLTRLYPDTPIVVITALRNAGLLAALLRQGVRGLVEKGGDVAQLRLALQAVSKGREYVSHELRMLLVANESKPGKRNMPSLTRAEIEVLRLFAYNGLTSQQISERLNRSRKTISRHKRSAQAKLGLQTDQELLEYCRRVDLSGI